MWSGWLLLVPLVALGFSGVVAVAGAIVVLVVCCYMAWSYPVACIVSTEGICIRTLIHRRTMVWSQIVEVRRTRGPLRRRVVEGKHRLRPASGALLFVLDDHRKVLALGNAEGPVAHGRLMAVMEVVSPALADSLRLYK
jgi:hypothetical protein